jgi:tetratricopeptide (TPR) repeat protein
MMRNCGFRAFMTKPIVMLGLGAGWNLGVTGCDRAGDAPGSASQGEAAPGSSTPAPAPEPPVALDDDALAGRYVAIRDRLEGDLAPSATERAALQTQLLEISNSARDPHLRANASLLLGSLLEATGDRTGAVAHYRHAAKLVPEDAGPHMALAAGLAAAGQLPEALAAQQQATALDPDNLENWLALGELSLRTGDRERATAAYVDYERRRKGLIDGLTLTSKTGEYLVSEEERIGCAQALASASDAGTAVALIYALAKDDSAKVRAAVARVMGIQRLRGFVDPLEARVASASDPDAKEAIQWALGEIVRDPIEVEPGPRAALDPSDPRANPNPPPGPAAPEGGGGTAPSADPAAPGGADPK